MDPEFKSYMLTHMEVNTCSKTVSFPDFEMQFDDKSMYVFLIYDYKNKVWSGRYALDMYYKIVGFKPQFVHDFSPEKAKLAAELSGLTSLI